MKKPPLLILLFIFAGSIFARQKHVSKQLPIGVFDSGTGGLTILPAILTLNAFNNKTSESGSDGIPDFSNEAFQYLADQAYHRVSLLEKRKRENYTLPLNTLILGCTHYPYLKDTNYAVLKELYNYQSANQFVYRKYLAADVAPIDPSVETAKEAYIALRKQHPALPKPNPIRNQFFIRVPHTSLKEAELPPDGWFTYAYKYGRTEKQARSI